MKKLMSLVLLVGLSTTTFSQIVDTTTYVYCKATGISKIVTTANRADEVDIYLDFGNGKEFSPKHPMKDEAGKDVIFTSVVDLINFMGERKWSLDKAYQSIFGSSAYRLITEYLFKKPKYKAL